MLNIERALKQDQWLQAMTGLNWKALDALGPTFSGVYEQSLLQLPRQRAMGGGREACLRNCNDKLNLFHVDSTDLLWKNPDWLGSGYIQEIPLSEGLSLVILDLQFNQDFSENMSMYQTCLEFEFCLEGVSPGTSSIELHLGQEKLFQVQAGQRALMVEVFATAKRLETYLHCLLAQMPAKFKQTLENYFELIYQYSIGGRALTPPLAVNQVLSNMDMPLMAAAIARAAEEITTPDGWREFALVWQSTTNPFMQTVLNQILNCPYHGTMRQLHLESKALELIMLRLDQVAQVGQLLTHHNLLPAAEITQIFKAKEILLSNLQNPPSLSLLAQQVGLNDCTFKRRFRQVFGMSAFSCLQYHRLERAQQLLAAGGISVAQVASAVGYASRASFYKAFRQQFGINPSDYLTQPLRNSVWETKNSV